MISNSSNSDRPFRFRILPPYLNVCPLCSGGHKPVERHIVQVIDKSNGELKILMLGNIAMNQINKLMAEPPESKFVKFLKKYKLGWFVAVMKWLRISSTEENDFVVSVEHHPRGFLIPKIRRDESIE